MACNQTHVAKLQELCVGRKWSSPVYEDVFSGGPPNDPVFHIQVTLANGITAKGVGRQKKAAKHDAAKNALDMLKLPALTDGNKTSSAKAQFSHLVNPHDEFTGNAVGELTEMCVSNHLPAPQFTLIGDEGEPHQKTFTYRCSVSSRHETGIARKKQTAKHQAALNMIKTLKANFKDYLSESQDAKATQPKEPSPEVTVAMSERDIMVINKYKQIKESDAKLIIPSFDHGLKICDYHLAYKEKLSNFNEIMTSSPIHLEKDPIKKVHMVAEALNHKITTTVAACKRGYLAFMLLDTVPSAVQTGMDSNQQEAERLAAIQLLEFLTVMAM